MSSPDRKRQKLADDVNSVAKMLNVETQTDNDSTTVSASNKRSVIDVSAQRFEDVASSDGFVDRTMLIEELLHREPIYAMMFAPSKFGKTINLTMIRLFCDIEDKDTKTKEDVSKDPTMRELRSNPSKNMKVFLRQFEDTTFEECLILKKEKFVIQHFGRHPVVFFNFKDCRAENKSEAIFECAKQVRIGYLENEYLKNSKEFQSDSSKHVLLKKTCITWLGYSDDNLESLSVGKVIDGLKNLIMSLSLHWGRDPVFLVDEIDKPCVAAMESELSKRQVREIGTTITDVVCSILKSEDKQLKLQAALLTGICKLRNSGLSTMDNTMEVYFLSDDRFSKYYGLTAQEVDSLVRKLCGPQGDVEIKKIISDINANYNGYYQGSSSGENKEYSRYCLFSVLRYIKEISLNKDKNKVKLCFWTDGGFLTGPLVSVLKKSTVIMTAVHTLLYGDSGTIAMKYQSAVNVEDLLGLYREEMNPDPHAVFNFFLQRGYLAHNPEKTEDNFTEGAKIHVRIPNLEIKEIYRTMFEKYHEKFPEDIKSKLTSCGEIFESLPTQNSTQFQRSLDRLCEHLACIFRYVHPKNESSICSHILTILKHYAYYEKGDTEYVVQYFDNNNKPCWVRIDVWGGRGNFAVIFEVKYNSNASSEPGKIGSKEKSSLAAAEDIVKLLPNKINPENGSSKKAGTGRDLQALKSFQIEHYVLVGLAVDGDYTTHMLVFRDTTDWENVIQVNPENHVAELISTHLNS
ncbi:unnamed protein product [Tenebrio molitor]|nr:unnamed protein product [Tenebrio molitor]